MRHYDIRKNIEKIVFRALSNGAIRISLRCSGAEIYRFLMLHSKRIILYLQLLPTRPRLTLLCTQPFLLVVFLAPQSTSFQTSSASACLISGRFLCFFFIFSLWLRYLTAVRAAHGWHDYCVNPPQYVIYRPLCLIRECPAVASLEFYFHFFYRIFLRKRKLSSAYWRKSPNYAM